MWVKINDYFILDIQFQNTVIKYKKDMKYKTLFYEVILVSVYLMFTQLIIYIQLCESWMIDSSEENRGAGWAALPALLLAAAAERKCALREWGEKREKRGRRESEQTLLNEEETGRRRRRSEHTSTWRRDSPAGGRRQQAKEKSRRVEMRSFFKQQEQLFLLIPHFSLHLPSI